MSTYSRKFTIASHPDDVYLVTWEQAYRNVRVYYKQELVMETDGVAKLMRGVSMETTHAGIVRLGLTEEKPITLTLHVNGERYYSANERTEELDLLHGISTVFWIIFGLGLVGFVIFFSLAKDLLALPGILPALVIDGLLVLTYGVSAFLCRKGYVAGYYIGTILFTLTTVFSLLGNGSLNLEGFFFFLALVIRGLILFYLFRHLNKIINMKRGQRKSSSPDLLDDLN